MRVLLIGETGRGKTFTALTMSKKFDTTYIDTERGTELWFKEEFKDLRSSIKLIEVNEWNDKIGKNLLSFKADEKELVVLDSLSELLEHYKDYLQKKVKKDKKYPMPTGSGVVDLTSKGIDPELIVLPMQMYSLIYDTTLNVLSTCLKAKHCIVTMHPIETRQITMDGKIVHSAGKLSFLQSVYRKVDIILKYKDVLKADILKVRGHKKEEDVNPIDFLKEVMI